MKKILFTATIIGIALIIWGIVDLSHWNTIGKGMLQHYADVSAVKQLVTSTLFGGIIKILIGTVLTGISFARDKNDRR